MRTGAVVEMFVSDGFRVARVLQFYQAQEKVEDQQLYLFSNVLKTEVRPWAAAAVRSIHQHPHGVSTLEYPRVGALRVPCVPSARSTH